MRGWRPIVIAGVVTMMGCADAGEISSPAPAALFSCVYGGGLRLSPGEVVRLEGEAAGAVCLEGTAAGADYLYVPFNASDAGAVRLSVEVTGGGIGSTAATSSASPSRSLDARPVMDEEFHHRLRLRELRDLDLGSARAPSQVRTGEAARAVPAVGDLIPINTSATCATADIRVGRVEAVSATAVIVADTANPLEGFLGDDWEFFAAAFDTLVDPVVTTNFGEPTDIDGNGRVIVFFTSAVNQLTEPGSGFFVGGFFWAGDLFPRSECEGSNAGEVFYMMVPDPERAVTEPPFATEFVRRSTLGTIGHEYQHLINAARRIYQTNAQSLEQVWLNEGLSHIAEELLYYAATGLGPRQNIDVQDIRSSDAALEAFRAFGVANFGRFLRYLEDPADESLMGQDNLPTRGAAWAFLRYAADRDPSPDAALFRQLAGGPATGVENLRSALDTDPIDWMQDWTVSVYTDDLPGLAVPAELIQPSWNFRSIMPVLAGSEGYPLRVLVPAPGARTETSLLAGGAAFVRFGVREDGAAFLSTTSGGAVPPARLRVSVVRIR